VSAALAYVVAGSKPWNSAEFDVLAHEQPGQWFFVAEMNELIAVLNRISPRYIFFLHWNWRVPSEIFSKFECVCFHMTDVPYGRGGSPLQNLIVAGHKTTKLTALRMVKEMDAGPIYIKEDISLGGRAEDIYRRAGLASLDIIRFIVSNEPLAVPQEGEPVVFKRRSPGQSVLPDSGDLRLLYDHIRMLDAPTYPLAFLNYGKFLLTFSDARLNGEELQATVIFRKQTLQEGDK
jgi:methionyl-tRNA formyltransferase